MQLSTHDSNHGPVTTSVEPRRLYRRPDLGILGGVATGIAEHVRVPAKWIRLAFVVLALAGGLGVALYAAYLFVLPTAPHAGRSRWPYWLEYLLAAIAAVASVTVFATSAPAGSLFAPLLLACIGGALIWRQASEPDRARLRIHARTSLEAAGRERLGRVRLVSGAALVMGGAAWALARADFSAFRDGLLAVIVTIVGLVLITGPWWMRMATQLSAERAERIRNQILEDLAQPVTIRKNVRTSPRASTTRCCRRSRSSNATPTRRARLPDSLAGRSARCARCSTATEPRPVNSVTSCAPWRWPSAT